MGDKRHRARELQISVSYLVCRAAITGLANSQRMTVTGILVVGRPYLISSATRENRCTGFDLGDSSQDRI